MSNINIGLIKEYIMSNKDFDYKIDGDIIESLNEIEQLLDLLNKKSINLYVFRKYGSSCKNYNSYCCDKKRELTEQDFNLIKKYFPKKIKEKIL